MNTASQNWFDVPNSPAVRVALGALLLVNVVVALYALRNDRGYEFLLYAYWADFVIVGVFTVVKLLVAFVMSRRVERVWGLLEAARDAGGFVLLMFLYAALYAVVGMLLFLAMMLLPAVPGLLEGAADATLLKLPSGKGLSKDAARMVVTLLFANHAISFVLNYLYRSEYRDANLFVLALQPFLRTGLIVVALLVAVGVALSLPGVAKTTAFAVVLVALKIIADVVGHLNERKRFAPRISA